MIDYFYLGLYKGFGFILKLLPEDVVIWLMKQLSSLAYTVGKKHRRIIHTNLDIAFDNTMDLREKKAIGKAAYMNLIDTLFGIMRRDTMSKAEVIKNVTFTGVEIVDEVIKKGNKIIFVTGHYGNWELASQALAIKLDLRLVGVGRKLDSALMDDVVKKNRERFNVEMVYKRGAMKGCISALNTSKSVGILIDQSLPKAQGIKVNFFGKSVSHTTLASILARRYETVLIPLFIHTDDYKQYHITMYTPIDFIKSENKEDDIFKMTQAQADIMEDVIRKDPNQWFWMHKRWKVYHPEFYEEKK